LNITTKLISWGMSIVYRSLGEDMISQMINEIQIIQVSWILEII